MEHLEEITVNGSLRTYRVLKGRTVADLLNEMKLETKFFAILANGKKVGLSDTIEKGTEIIILPKLAGGY